MNYYVCSNSFACCTDGLRYVEKIDHHFGKEEFYIEICYKGIQKRTQFDTKEERDRVYNELIEHLKSKNKM